MVPGGGPCDTCPDLLKPNLVSVRGYHTQHPCRNTRAAVSAGLPLHKDEFDVIFDYSIGLVGLAKKSAAITLGLINGVGYLVPDNRSEVAEPDPPAMFLD